MTNPEVQAAYPKLADLPTTSNVQIPLQEGAQLFSSRARGPLRIAGTSPDVLGMQKNLAHEGQHVIQHAEGFPDGSSPATELGNLEHLIDNHFDPANPVHQALDLNLTPERLQFMARNAYNNSYNSNDWIFCK